MKRTSVKAGCFWALVSGTCFALVVAPDSASSQQVRILEDETVIRLDPDDSSPSLGTLSAGTVLDWVGRSGPWYSVSIPGPPGQDDLIGFVHENEIEFVGGAAAPGGAPTSAGVPIPGPQQQFSNAKQSRKTGISTAALGAGVAASAQMMFTIVFEVEEESSYDTPVDYRTAQDRRKQGEQLRDGALIVGGALVAYGVGRYVLGWRKMEQLRSEFPEGSLQSFDARYAEARLGRTLGQRKVITGAVLGAAAYATRTAVPAFKEPDPEDFDDEAEYLDAVSTRSKVETATAWVGGAGAVLGAWGVAQWVLASQRIGGLEAQRGFSALSLPVTPAGTRVHMDLFLDHTGDSADFGVRWTW